jgi:hypothetical protein
MRRLSPLVIIVLAASPVVSGTEIVWTETFDTGVGRLDQTQGHADSTIVWNPSTKRLDGEFIRYSSADRRYALLDRTLTSQDTFGFTAVVTPTAVSPDSYVGAKIGFWDSSESPMETWLGVKLRDTRGSGDIRSYMVMDTAEGYGGSTGGALYEFEYGQTYFLDFFYHPGVVTLNIYSGSSPLGTLLHSTSGVLSPNLDITLDALGLGNMTGGSTTFWMSTDNVSFLIPEPSTALPLLGTSFFFKRRRRST